MIVGIAAVAGRIVFKPFRVRLVRECIESLFRPPAPPAAGAPDTA
jgi:hypothetical protein